MRCIFLCLVLAVFTVAVKAQSIYDDTAAHWRFDEGSGQIVSDSSGNGNNLFIGINEDVTKDANWLTPGFLGSSVHCFKVPEGLVSSGTGAAADLNALDMDGDSSYTVAVWAKCLDLSNGLSYLLSKMESSGNFRGWFFSVRASTITDNPERLEFLLRNVNSSTTGRLWVRSVEKVSDITDFNGWVHLAVTYSGSRRASGVKFYINGEPVLTNITFDNLQPGQDTTCTIPFNICGRNNVAQSNGAYVDEVAIWHRVLNAAEIQQAVDETLRITSTPTDSETIVFERTASSDTIDITLAYAPTDDVTVTIEGNPLFDFGSGAGSSHSVVFTTSELTRTITVTAVQNTTIETRQQYNVPLSSVSSDANFNNAYILPLKIKYVDDDGAGVVLQYTGTAVTVHEQGQTSDIYTLALTVSPFANVTVTPVYDPNEITISPAEFVFTSSNYAVAQTFTVTAIDDAIAARPEVYFVPVSHTFVSGDYAYNNLPMNTLNVQKYDNDCAAPFANTDINKDCQVDLQDFKLMVIEWLNCTFPDVPGCEL